MINRKLCLRRCLVMLLVILTIAPLGAQPRKHPPFNPAKFQADMEAFITKEACLTPKEAAKFFPVYRQMMKKQRALFDEMRRFRLINPKDNRACSEAIRQQDELDIQIKLLQQEYHSRFMMILSPSKVLDIIKAEERFHREMLRKAR